MGATSPLKKVKELIPQVDPPKEGNTVKKMNGQLILFSSDKANTNSKNGRLQVLFWKKKKIK